LVFKKLFCQDPPVPEENMHDNASDHLDITAGSPDFTHVNDNNE